jgi:valyl-tRNA synthetase
LEFLSDRANATFKVSHSIFTAPSQLCIHSAVGDLKVTSVMPASVDLAAHIERTRKRIDALEKAIAGKRARLGNADYVARAPAQQVAETRDMLAKEEVELVTLKETLAGL